MSKEKSQRAELRVALELDGKHALIAQANLKGGDIYCGTPSRPVKGKKREIVRSSFHAGGPTRLHRLGLATLAGHFGMKSDEVKGAVLLSQGGPGGMLDWTYKVRADSSTRKTLVLQCDRRIAGSMSMSYWAVESGIADPVKAALELGLPAMDVVGQVVSDSTVPQVMILVMVLPEASIASLEATIRAEEEAKRAAAPRPEMTSAAGVHVIFTTGRPFSIHQAAKARIAKANQYRYASRSTRSLGHSHSHRTVEYERNRMIHTTPSPEAGDSRFRAALP